MTVNKNMTINPVNNIFNHHIWRLIKINKKIIKIKTKVIILEIIIHKIWNWKNIIKNN
jgi:hypothetical protein